jgi:hypothetical protein
MDRKMKPDPDFTPCPVEEDDDLYHNGIFIFNITSIIEFITQNPDLFPLHPHYSPYPLTILLFQNLY